VRDEVMLNKQQPMQTSLASRMADPQPAVERAQWGAWARVCHPNSSTPREGQLARRACL